MVTQGSLWIEAVLHVLYFSQDVRLHLGQKV